MLSTYLAIEQSDEVHERESGFWQSRNISAVRVTSMNEGIEKALNGQFLFIGINADNIDYKPVLRILRDATFDPIFIAATNYFMQDAGIAYELGADLYGKAGDTPEDNYSAVMRKIKSLNYRQAQPEGKLSPIIFDDVLFATAYHRIFIGDAELKLTKIEMDILLYMMENPGRILTHEHINRQFLKGDNHKISTDSIYGIMKRLRKKMKGLSQFDYIEAVRDIGYRLNSRSGMN